MEAGKALCCLSPLGTSGGSEDLEKSDLAKGSTGQSKDMGPTCKQVVALIRSILEPFITNVDWLHRNHRAEKRRQDCVSHGRPHSQRESSWSKMLNHAKQRCESKITQSVEPIETGNRGKRRLDPPGGEKAERRGSGRHTMTLLACERTLHHFRRNTRN